MTLILLIFLPTVPWCLKGDVTYISAHIKKSKRCLGFWISQHWIPESSDWISWIPDTVRLYGLLISIVVRFYKLFQNFIQFQFSELAKTTKKVLVNLKIIWTDVNWRKFLNQIVQFSLVQSWIKILLRTEEGMILA